MEAKSIFSTLMELPLFRGVTRDKMLEVVGKTKSHFLRYESGAEFISAGEPCTHLNFLLRGEVRLNISNRDGSFTVSQNLIAPNVIAPDYLFGMATDFPCSVTTITDTSILQISKSDYLKILNTDSVFMFNYLNLLAMNAQKAVEGVLSLTDGTVEERIALWIIALSKPSSRNIALHCRNREFCTIFGVNETTLSNALEDMKKGGLIDYTNNAIYVVDRRGLLELLHQRRKLQT